MVKGGDLDAQVPVAEGRPPPDDLRYLLSLVAEKDQRIKELEAAVRRTAIVYDEAEPGQYRCRHCGATLGHGEGTRVPHDPSCIVLTLPAPETVETQG